MQQEKLFAMSFASVYPLYVAKAQRKGRTKSEVDEIIFWLTGHDADSLRQILDTDVTMKAFFDDAPQINPNASRIKGVICGHRVEEIEDETMRLIRCLDKLIDELAKGKPMDKMLQR